MAQTQRQHDPAHAVASLEFHWLGERFRCRLYAGGHLEVSHPEFGVLVEPPLDTPVADQAKRLAGKLLAYRRA